MSKPVVGVVGTGLMGVGIATQSALYGHRTIVNDVDPTRLESVVPKAQAVLDELIDAGCIDEQASHLMHALAKDEDVLDLLRAQVQAGRVGVRSGAGFYDWDDALTAKVEAGRKRMIQSNGNN
ncbi:3-hydroxyacyl-CoA dehydrogenase NAD-binding domain-containing protein [Paraburkholderia phymatum]|uniref:3-hydroxyacyl-CoA dehydrogenase NAD-binding domain-containing protein n=1 Tax=Paraburkholderia phymatum TaxID=148447 RepID=UPI000A02263F|nr:3-hydroxyacyl-CoA dehydrogenase NAD-binding domain-containing protein [Paraburkholderia phymatum]